MKTDQTVYIGIDLHSNTSTIGYMNKECKYIGQRQVQTSVMNLINQVVAIPGQVKKFYDQNMAIKILKFIRLHWIWLFRKSLCHLWGNDPAEGH